jgi:hypothetical protein
MSRFIKTLALFVAGLQLSPARAASAEPNTPRLEGGDDVKGVSLQPLNGKFDNLFAGHASHSSHRSHASHSSHYSGSSGYATPYVAPAPAPLPSPTPAPVPLPMPVTELVPRIDAQGSTAPSGNAATEKEIGSVPHAPAAPRSNAKTVVPASTHSATGAPSPSSDLPMTLAEKLRLQIIRVQIRLNSLGLYNGQISGTLDSDTRAALRLFQKVKSIPESGQMTTPTLNALGIPAVK